MKKKNKLWERNWLMNSPTTLDRLKFLRQGRTSKKWKRRKRSWWNIMLKLLSEENLYLIEGKRVFLTCARPITKAFEQVRVPSGSKSENWRLFKTHGNIQNISQVYNPPNATQVTFHIALSYLASLYKNLFIISHAFTLTKDYSPKCQFQNYSHYVVKRINL